MPTIYFLLFRLTCLYIIIYNRYVKRLISGLVSTILVSIQIPSQVTVQIHTSLQQFIATTKSFEGGIRVGDSPTNLAVNTVTNKIYTSNNGFTYDVSVVDGLASKILTTNKSIWQDTDTYFRDIHHKNNHN
jgi:DNA-binding beta-propeller fold protein YncE